MNIIPQHEVATVEPIKLFRVKKNGKSTTVGGFSLFASYEEARQAIRRSLRVQLRKGKVERLGWWDSVSRNPTGLKSQYGYSIVQA